EKIVLLKANVCYVMKFFHCFLVVTIAYRLVPVACFFYLITLSALYKTDCGIVRPICLAALRLMINSNLTGCSTGSSAGLAPFKILSTYVAARRNKSVLLTL